MSVLLQSLNLNCSMLGIILYYTDLYKTSQQPRCSSQNYRPHNFIDPPIVLLEKGTYKDVISLTTEIQVPFGVQSSSYYTGDTKQLFRKPNYISIQSNRPISMPRIQENLVGALIKVTLDLLEQSEFYMDISIKK